MKITPILFSAEMIRALLDGRKTQTRRIVQAKHVAFVENLSQRFFDNKWGERPLPYGKPGDLLYARETFEWCDIDGSDAYRAAIYYRADEGAHNEATWLDVPDRDRDKVSSQYRNNKKSPWRPGIHLYRWASRLTLELTYVRVERLQDISNEDAVAEGIGTPTDIRYAAIDGYKPLWESINGASSWNANPWVWVLGFKVHKMNIDQFLKLAAA